MARRRRSGSGMRSSGDTIQCPPAAGVFQFFWARSGSARAGDVLCDGSRPRPGSGEAFCRTARRTRILLLPWARRAAGPAAPARAAAVLAVTGVAGVFERLLGGPGGGGVPGLGGLSEVGCRRGKFGA